MRQLVVVEHHATGPETGSSTDRVLRLITDPQASADVPPQDYREFAASVPLAVDMVGRHVVSTAERLRLGTVDGGERIGESWWSLEISERSPFRGKLMSRLYSIALLDAVLDDNPGIKWSHRVVDPVIERVLLSASPGAHPTPAPATPPSWSVIRYWRRALLAAVRGARRAVGRSPALPTAGDWIFTMFPAWWGKGEQDDRFFSDPPGSAKFVAWMTGDHSTGAPPVFPLQRFLRVRDLLSMVSLRRFMGHLRLARALRSMQGLRLGRFDVSAIWADELARSLCGGEQFLCEMLARSSERWARVARPRRLIYRTEFQPWENALLTGVRGGSASTSTAGFFHSPFATRYLPLRLTPLEAAGDGANPRPLPDSFFVCGPVGERLLRADGVRQSIQEVGPQRHASMVKYMRARPNRDEIRRSLDLSPDDQVLLVGIAIVEAETSALLDAVYEACRATRHRVLVRTHPNRPQSGEAVATSLARWEEGRARVLAGGSLYEQLDAADAAVMIGSTAAFEAMVLGTMPIIFEFRGTYPATSLREYEQGLYTAADALELRAALEEISPPMGEGALRRAAAWPRLVEDVFGNMQGSLAAQISAAVDNM